MQVLVVAANTIRYPAPVYPLGAACIAAALREAGHEISLLDLGFERAPAAALGRAVRRRRPALTALSLRNGDSTAYPTARSFLPHFKALARSVREHGSGQLVLGGPAATLYPEPYLGETGADALVLGEGEQTVVALCAALQRGDDVSVLPGVVTPATARLAGEPAAAEPAADLDALPEPAWDLLPPRRYLRRAGEANFQTKRGCAFRCVYCPGPRRFEGPGLRLMSPELVVGRLERLVRQHGIDSVFLVDNVFNQPADHAKAICEAIVGSGLKLRWSCQLSPAGFDDELAALLVRAGCASGDFGLDSAVDEVLEGLGKPFRLDDIERAAAACQRAGLRFCASLLFGGPNETLQTAQRTVERIEALRPTAVVAMGGIRILPGTPLERLAIEEGRLGPEGAGHEPVFYLSPGMEDTLLPFLREKHQSLRGWVLPSETPEAAPLWADALRFLGMRGPLWELLRFRRRSP